MKKLFLLITILFLLTTAGFGQNDYALFIHGFQGSADSWIDSGTPEDWETAGVIDDYVAISYQTSELKTSAGQQQVITRIANEMLQLDPQANANWLLVGHSMGGLVARVAYHELKNNQLTQNFNIDAVLTVGAPHQGARAAGVSLGYVPGYANVQPDLDEFIHRTTVPLNSIHGSVGILANLASPDALEQLENAPLLIENAIKQIEYFENASVTNRVKDVIGINGSLIQDINSGFLDEPSFKRSVIGAEKRFIIVRAANEILGAGNGDEASTLDNFDDIRWFYRANANAWDAQETIYNWTLQFGKAADARRKRDRWNRGRNALDNIDGTWGEMIDSYVIEPVEVPQWTYICTNNDPGDPGQLPPGTGEGDCWEWQYVWVDLPVATKNDVLIGPDYAVWNPNEDPDDQVINWYYDDVPADGGYNHFELRRHKRAYELSGVFNQGDIAPPMGQAAVWLDDVVFDN